MARPKKKGVDYYPHDCVTGRTIFVLEQKFGNDGYAFWFKLLEFLGTKEGHYLDCNDIADMEFLQAKTRLDEVMICRILDLLSNLEAIDRELWHKKVVWSQRFVDGISDVYTNRRQKIPERPSFYIVSTVDNPVEIDYGDESTSKSTQSKVKESKEEESKEKENGGFKAGNGTDSMREEKLFDGEAPAPDDSILTQLWVVWKNTFPKYTADRENDFQGLGKIYRFMCRHGTGNYHDPTNIEYQLKVLNTFQAVADEVAKSNFWENKPLKSIANNIQEFYNKIKNPVNGNGKEKPGTRSTRIDINKVKEAHAKRYGGGG